MIKSEKIIMMLSKIPLFTNLDKKELQEIITFGEEIKIDKGNNIVIEGDLIDSIILIVEGVAEVHKKENHDTVLEAVIRPGETIGLHSLSFFSKSGLRTATVIAITPVTLIRLSLQKLRSILEKYSNISSSLLEQTKEFLKYHLIKEAEPFRKLSNKKIIKLAKRIEEKKYNANEVIFKEGDSADCCYVIASGTVQILIKDNQKKVQSLAKLESPSIFGEVGLITATPRNATALALTDVTVLKLCKKDFLEIIAREKSASVVISALIRERVRPISNKNIIIYQRHSTDGEELVTLKNPEKNTYYQLSAEGWFVFQQLNGKHTLHDLTALFHKKFKGYSYDFVYELIVDLVEGGFAIYNKEKIGTDSSLSIVTYDSSGFTEIVGKNFEDCFPLEKTGAVTWINVEGLNNVSLIDQIAHEYKLHPLTVGDILNVDQRSKVEEFEDYKFITLKSISWSEKTLRFRSEQVSLILGKGFVLSFIAGKYSQFTQTIKNYLHTKQSSHMREQGSDYLVYRLLDSIIDEYFVVLESVGEHIEKIEENILTSPTPQNARSIYRVKRQMLMLRKIIWPVRESISHLLNSTGGIISSATALYFRDLYDHIAQAIDTLETFRDMLSGMLDVYLSSISNRMNEIMKVLTIISTIFIPITFVTGVFGMNFKEMPILEWRGSFYWALGLMLLVAVAMLIYFRNKKWI